MTKQEFLDELRQMLSGEVSSEVVMDSYRYYATYIEEEVRGGKEESQVLEELGRPALIARSIIAANSGEREADEIYTEDGRTKRARNNPFSSGAFGTKDREERREEKVKKEKKPFVFDFGAWYAKVLYVLLLILLVLFVFGIIRIGFWVLLHWGIPILLVLGILYLLMYFMN